MSLIPDFFAIHEYPVGCALISTMTQFSGKAMQVGYLLIAGFGMGKLPFVYSHALHNHKQILKPFVVHL